MKSKLIDKVKTKDEINTLSEEINLLKSSVYKNGKNDFENTLKYQIRKSTADIVLSEISGSDATDYLENLSSELGKINAVAITLAYEPSQISIERFYEFVQSSIPKKIVLDVLYDPQIVGGVVVSYGGRYKDYSFRKVFEEDLESTRTEILNYLASHK